MTSTFDASPEAFQSRPMTHNTAPTSLRILTIILFTGFAIPVSIVAIVHFWPAGIALAAFFAYQWVNIAGMSPGTPVNDAVEMLRPSVPEAAPKSSGNASFDAYRDDLLTRLESEQTNFETFLSRLREAKDKTEFDDFMEARAKAARSASNDSDA